ncbi:GPI ethanolamine phosphate transferase 3, partial [Dictyocoela roeselum]
WTDKFEIKKYKTIESYENTHDFNEEIKIMEELINSVNKYDTIIAHLLFLDHFGHMYTIYHKKISDVLKAYDELILNIYDKMDNETLFVIASDHGVDEYGNHGNVSVQELSSMCAIITKDMKFDCKDKNIDKGRVLFNKIFKELRDNYLKSSCCTDTNWIHHDKNPEKITDYSEDLNIIHQSDILPTICNLMGWEFPLYNCGNYIHEAVSGGYKELILQKVKLMAKINRDRFSKIIRVINEVMEDFMSRNKSNTRTKRLGNKKRKNLKNADFSKEESNLMNVILLKMNYILTEVLYEEMSGCNSTNLVIGTILLMISFTIQVRRISKGSIIRISISAFIIIMTSHSVYSYIHEDLFWLFLFLIQEFSMKNFILGIILFNAGKFPIHEFDRKIFLKKSNFILITAYLFLKCINYMESLTRKRLLMSLENYNNQSLNLESGNVISHYELEIKRVILSYIRLIIDMFNSNIKLIMNIIVSIFLKNAGDGFALPYMILNNDISPFIFEPSTLLCFDAISENFYLFKDYPDDFKNLSLKFRKRRISTKPSLQKQLSNFALMNIFVFLMGMNYSFSTLNIHLIFNISKRLTMLFKIYFAYKFFIENRIRFLNYGNCTYYCLLSTSLSFL